MDNHPPFRAIENVGQSEGDVSSEKLLQYNRYMKKAREAAEAGLPKKSLELLKQAAAIQSTDKVLKRIRKIEAFLAANSDSEDEDDGLVHLGKGYHLMKDVHDKLYPYQRECLLWFWRLHRKNKGGILGDDMGLGKTIQVVAFLTGLFDMQQVRSVLIVLPVAVIINWEREFEKWSPGINVQCFHGSSKRDKERALARVQRRGGVLLTSYGLVLTSFKQMVQLDGHEFVWDYIILDEGHKIKNPGKTTKAAHSIPAKHRFILTGTPIQNNLKEMWALFDFVTQGSVLGTIRTFMMEYGNPITRARERDATSSEKLLGNEMAESLRTLIEPYFLRRTKADVLENKENLEDRGCESNSSESRDVSIPRLTRKNDFIIWLYLTDTQIQIYKDFTQLDQVKELLMTQRSPLAELTVLKKLCDHPRLLTARACQQLGLQTTEKIEDLPNSDDDSNQVKDTRAAACNIKEIDDEILMAESGKIQFLLELLYNLTEQGHRTLVFSQSRKMLDILEKILRNRNFKYMRLDGTVSKLSDREQRIKAFQSNQSYSVFLLTTQVGGVGLTLTGADRVVILDPSWNPATDAQAVDRAYRIGQTKSVVIYRLITCGTVEEKIYRRQVFKDSITKQATGASKNPYRYFSRQDLKELFILDDPKRSKTQEQLEEMHSAHRKSDTELDSHIAFLHSLDTMYGLSDHDLMFSQEAVHEENEGFETETDDYIQRRVQRAQELVSAESDLTVQLKEQLESNTQPPGLHPHISEINTDRARLKKTWEQVHGEPDQKEILRPGADYEERYVSKKRPEPEYDLTNESDGENSDVILDQSGGDTDIESVSPKSGSSCGNNSHHQGPLKIPTENRGDTSDQNVSSIVIEDSDEEREDNEGGKDVEDIPDISSSSLPPFDDNGRSEKRVQVEDMEDMSFQDGSGHDHNDASLIQGADMDIQCDLGSDSYDTTREESSSGTMGPLNDDFQEERTDPAAAVVSYSPGKHAMRELLKDGELMTSPNVLNEPMPGAAEGGSIGTVNMRSSICKDDTDNEGSATDEEPIKEAADFEIQCELGTTVFEDTDDEETTGNGKTPQEGSRRQTSRGNDRSWAAGADLDESVNMMQDLSIAGDKEDPKSWAVSTSTPSKGGTEGGQVSLSERGDSLLPQKQRPRKLVADSDDEDDVHSFNQPLIAGDSDEGGPIRDESQASMIAESDCDVSAIQESFQDVMEPNELKENLKLQMSPNGDNFMGSFRRDQNMAQIENIPIEHGVKEGNYWDRRTPAGDVKLGEDQETFSTPQESFSTPRESFSTAQKRFSSLQVKGRTSMKKVKNGNSVGGGMTGVKKSVLNGDDGGENGMWGEKRYGRDVSDGDHSDGRSDISEHANGEEDVSMVSQDGLDDVSGTSHGRDDPCRVNNDDELLMDNPVEESLDQRRGGIYSDGTDCDVLNDGSRAGGSRSRGYMDGVNEDNLNDTGSGGGDDSSRKMPGHCREGGCMEGANIEGANGDDVAIDESRGEEDDEMEDGDEFACSEDLDEEGQEKYYQFLDRGEQYLENGKKTKALKYFLMALNVDNSNHALQLRTYSLAQERERMKAQGQQA